MLRRGGFGTVPLRQEYFEDLNRSLRFWEDPIGSRMILEVKARLMFGIKSLRGRIVGV